LTWLFFSSGRAWTAAELRRKSFRDLHTLWYVLLRERNLIATQKESYRRATVPFGVLRNVERRDHQVRRLRDCVSLVHWTRVLTYFILKCRKGMARIKYVINERRLAYEGAVKIHAEKVEQATKENETETERVDDSPVYQESEERKVSPPPSEATQAAVDGLLQRSTT
jgi:large subunit ribosomal protein L47